MRVTLNIFLILFSLFLSKGAEFHLHFVAEFLSKTEGEMVKIFRFANMKVIQI